MQAKMWHKMFVYFKKKLRKKPTIKNSILFLLGKRNQKGKRNQRRKFISFGTLSAMSEQPVISSI